ncbi:hypothetical protein Tco_0707473 [Tanacetum coccineum]|uniref:Uncharacterized protein n=1 Tax=Tanacetum coccineum TaxID=301880 RepID=A0ABQ4YBV7_9ASTR
METIHVRFDELSEPMAPVQLSTGPTSMLLTPGQIKPPHVERSIHPALAVPVPVNSAGIPSSTTIDQDAPSLTESTLMEDNLFAPVDNDPFINIFALEPTSEASSSWDVRSAESTYVTQTLHHLRK